MSQHYRVTTPLPVTVDEAFAYHERPGALQRLIPPWEPAEIEHSDQSITDGSRVVLRSNIFGVPIRWVAEHHSYDPPRLFADTQVSGPFAHWNHRHEFAPNDNSSLLTDDLTYQLRGGVIGKTLGNGLARKTIERMFAYRHRVTCDDLALLQQHPMETKTVAISGATGMVGGALSTLMKVLGHHVKTIVRGNPANDSEIAIWKDAGEASKFESVDAVVHLAGKPIASGRWTDSEKREIRDSRVKKTKELCERLARLERKPAVLVCASATGIYGDRGDEILSEQSELADDFLADVAREWEASCSPAIDAGIRVVNARFGLIVSPDGGALKQMLLPAKFFGGKLGDGQQWWSWIALDDVIGGIYHVIANENIRGPVNFTAPGAVRNDKFAETLGRVIGRPALVPAPKVALRAAVGEMADALLLASARVQPEVLRRSGYQFRFQELEPLLNYCLGKNQLAGEPVPR